MCAQCVQQPLRRQGGVSPTAYADRLYGTLYVPGDRHETFRLGLGDGTEGQWYSVLRLYLWPFA
jgi:hypothetical protein